MTRVPVPLELRCLRIPAKWGLRKDTISGEWNLVPDIAKDAREGTGKCSVIEKPWDIRDKFFRMKHEETAALDFLDEIGIWRAIGRPVPAWARSARLDFGGAFNHRFFSGWAQPITFEQLWKHQEHWRNLLLNPKTLRQEFGPPPPKEAAPFEKVDFAMKADFQNTLPVHMEWPVKTSRLGKGFPSAVVETVTGSELLVATTHIDLLSRAGFHVCQRTDCAIPFTGRKKKYCCWYCGHIVARRGQNFRKRTEREKERAEI
jgi:hypothetical protein